MKEAVKIIGAVGGICAGIALIAAAKLFYEEKNHYMVCIVEEGEMR